MRTFKAGFGRINITPMLGIAIRGYFKPRYADGVLDELEANALALSCDETTVLLLSVDNCGFPQALASEFRKYISEVVGLPIEAIFLSATHIHTGPGPELKLVAQDSLYDEYCCQLKFKLADVARFALDDRKPARMGWGIGHAPHISFSRRYRMKDGSIVTNPGVNNPEIVEPIGQMDERVNVLRFDQDDGNHLVLVNFGCHPDTVGGCKITADWPGIMRRTVEQALDGTKCLFFNGALGDASHVNVHPSGGDLNDMFMDFDDVSRGYGHARHMGRVVAAAVLQVYDKVKYTNIERIKYAQKMIDVPANVPSPEQIPEAKRINDLHEAGKDDELPYTGMMLTTVVAEAIRMLRLQNGPDLFQMPMHAIAIGCVAMVGIPGEPFDGIGRGIKDSDEWELILPCAQTNGDEGYFPMQEAYDEGGYEARSSKFKPGVAELIIKEGHNLLCKLI